MTSTIQELLEEVKDLAEEVSGVVNVYARRAVYADVKDFRSKFWDASKKRYLGFTIYRSAKATAIVGFAGAGNKVRHAHTITIDAIIGAEEGVDDATYNDLRDILDAIQGKLCVNLTLDGKVENAEMPTIGSIEFDSSVGRVMWRGTITWVLYQTEILGAIS